MTKYSLKITTIGSRAGDYLSRNIVVLFGEEASEELKQHALVHDHGELSAPIVPGDILNVGERRIEVRAVGNVVNDNLAELGHCVLKFNGGSQPDLEGDICLDAHYLPHLRPGSVLTFESGNGKPGKTQAARLQNAHPPN